ncbi:MAG: acyl-CoA dehydrogenase family protein [Acidimicrobiia bacterium]
MDLHDSPQQAEFRARLRAWLATNLPTEPEPGNLGERFRYMVAWQQSLYRGGWVALSWPKEYGGQGLGVLEEAILNEELGRAGAPTSLPLSYLGRPLLSHGTEAQRQAHLPSLLSAETIWCQGFSEPGAGSDLASLRTKAAAVDAGWSISGQKLWTSYGAFGDMCLLLARTSDYGPKHRGISAFIVPMDAPGVTVRPVVMGNGDEEFAEIFLDDVVIGRDALLGELGDGWGIAQATISYERGAVDIGFQAKFTRLFAELVDQVRDQAENDAGVRRKLGEVVAGLEALRMHSLRRLSVRSDGSLPGPESSVDKLLMTRVEQHMLSVAMELCDDHATDRRAAWFHHYLYARAGSIYGGSAQIQRNILANRVLGMRSAR